MLSAVHGWVCLYYDKQKTKCLSKGNKENDHTDSFIITLPQSRLTIKLILA